MKRHWTDRILDNGIWDFGRLGLVTTATNSEDKYVLDTNMILPVK